MKKKTWEIEDCLLWIENSTQDITIGELAELSGYSQQYFSQWFFASTGETAGRFLRRRRLSRAAGDIVAGKSIKDAALSCGFFTESGFILSFKKEYGFTPSEYRSVFKKLKTPHFEKWDVVKCVCYGLPPYGNREWNPFTYATHWLDADIYSVSEEDYAKLTAEGLGEVGFWSAPNENGMRTYYFGPVVRSFDRYPKGMIPIELPAATYAVFSTIPVNIGQNKYGFRQNIEDTKKYIFDDWLNNNGSYQLDPSKTMLEYYKSNSLYENSSPVDLYIPVTKCVSPKSLLPERGCMTKKDYVECVLKKTGLALTVYDLCELCEDISLSTIHHAISSLQKNGKIKKFGNCGRIVYQYIKNEDDQWDGF